MSARPQAEIDQRFAELTDGTDPFGFRSEVLIERVTFATARPRLRDGVTAEHWADFVADAEPVETEARDYLAFAVQQAARQRGISAERSVIKLREYLWLMGRDDAVAAMDAAEYAPYGVPKLRALAAALGWEWPEAGE